MWQIRRGYQILKNDGLSSLLKKSISYLAPSSFYNRRIWPLLPATAEYGTYNQVEVKGTHPMKLPKSSGSQIRHKILDNVVPWHTPSNIPNFKQPNIKQIHNNYREGDKVVIVGGGNGVSAVHTARIVGHDGKVSIFEADEERIRDLEKTLKHNQVFDICEINQSIVGKPHRVESPGDANVVHPSNLPRCDALEMDCEGAEFEILENLDNKPNKIIVELHHEKSFSPYSSPDVIESVLQEKGYSVQKYDGPWVNGLFVAEIE